MFVRLRGAVFEEGLFILLAEKYLGVKLAIGFSQVNALSIFPPTKD